MGVNVSGCCSLATVVSQVPVRVLTFGSARYLFLGNQIFYHLETFQECWGRWKESTCFLCDFYMEIHAQRSEVINFDLRKNHFLWKYVFFRGYYSNPCVIKNIIPPDS